MGLRYLFNKQDNNFVSLMQANLDLATTCLTYLCSDLFDPDLSHEDLEENILSGGYRLHGLAASQWAEFVTVCATMLRNQTPPNGLITLLECFIIERENIEYEGPDNDVPKPGELNLFKKDWPKLHTMLCRALKFRQSDIGDWRLSEGRFKLFPENCNSISFRLDLTKRLELRQIMDKPRPIHIVAHLGTHVRTIGSATLPRARAYRQLSLLQITETLRSTPFQMWLPHLLFSPTSFRDKVPSRYPR
jgi:hypothetical protein